LQCEAIELETGREPGIGCAPVVVRPHDIGKLRASRTTTGAERERFMSARGTEFSSSGA